MPQTYLLRLDGLSPNLSFKPARPVIIRIQICSAVPLSASFRAVVDLGTFHQTKANILPVSWNYSNATDVCERPRGLNGERESSVSTRTSVKVQ